MTYTQLPAQISDDDQSDVAADFLPSDLAEWTHVVVSELPTASTNDLLDALCQLTDWRRITQHETAITKLIEGLR